jgi:tetratricopeptide (TPR) repeat protein
MDTQTRQYLDKIHDVLSRKDEIEAKSLCKKIEKFLPSVGNEKETSILHFYLFRLLVLIKKDEEAIKYLDLPKKQDDDFELKFLSLFQYGLCLMRLRRREDGFSAFSELLELAESKDDDGWKIDVHKGMGKFYYQEDNWIQALYHFNEALYYSKKSHDFFIMPDLYFWIGNIFLQQDKYYLALDNFKEAEEKAVDIHNELLIYRNAIKRCEIYIKLGETEKVYEIIDRIVKGPLTLK